MEGAPAEAGAPSRSWEPVTVADLRTLAALASRANTVEGDALRWLEHFAAQPNDVAGIGELVAWAWVSDPQRQHVLLVDHGHFGRWLPPGGRTHPGEHPVDAVLRELREETGCSFPLVDERPALVDAIQSRSPDGTPVTTFGIAFLLEGDRAAPLSGEPGQRAQWWPLDAPPERRAEHHWRRLTAALARQA